MLCVFSQVVVVAGRPSERLYFIQRGIAHVLKATAGSAAERELVATLTENNFFGEVHGISAVSVQCVSYCDMLVLDKSTFGDVLQSVGRRSSEVVDMAIERQQSSTHARTVNHHRRQSEVQEKASGRQTLMQTTRNVCTVSENKVADAVMGGVLRTWQSLGKMGNSGMVASSEVLSDAATLTESTAKKLLSWKSKSNNKQDVVSRASSDATTVGTARV